MYVYEAWRGCSVCDGWLCHGVALDHLLNYADGSLIIELVEEPYFATVVCLATWAQVARTHNIVARMSGDQDQVWVHFLPTCFRGLAKTFRV